MADLRTNVIVSGSVIKGGFKDIQSQFVALSDYAQQLSEQLINFGKESAETYGNFEQNMADARAALATGTYRDDQAALTKAMNSLDAYAKRWAETTKFTTSDVSHAISEAAHAGWDYTQMIEGIPEAMLLAQAGGIELSTAMDYVVKSANATKTPFANLGVLIDEWVVAANMGATNVDEIGQAMVKLGQVSTFADSTAELMAMLALLANSGSVGTEAGTLLRNTMIRLVAPTKKAGDAMAQLGIDAGDMEEALGGDSEALEAAIKTLEKFGFSAYDEKGNLKSFAQIFRDLNLALTGMSEEQKNDILSTIFPQRSITGAKALLDGIASGDWDTLYKAIERGFGAAQNASDIMMNTQEGDLKILESRFEALKLAVGEELTGQIRGFADSMGNFLNSITNMDPAAFSALVTGLETIAGIGAGLGAAGTAVKVFASLGTAGLIGASAIAIAALSTSMADYIAQVDAAQYKGLFGDMEIDTTSLSNYAALIGGDFDEAAKKIGDFNKAMEESATSYQTASAALSGDLLTKMLTGGTLTTADTERLYNLGDDMYQALVDGITTGTASQMDFWEYLFGGSGTAENNGDYRSIIGTLNTGYNGALEEARGIGQGLRDALTEAFADGKLTQEEYNNILKYMEDYNRAISEATSQAASEQSLIDAQVALAKSQGVSLESLTNASSIITGKRDEGLDTLETQYLQNYFRLKNAGASDQELAAAQAAYLSTRYAQAGNYDSMLMALWSQGLTGSDMAGSYAMLQNAANMVLGGGTARQGLDALTGMKNGEQLLKYLDSYVAAMGGTDELNKRLMSYSKSGNTDMVNAISQLLMMRQLLESRTNWDLGTLGYYETKIDKQKATLQLADTIAAQQAYANTHPIVIQTISGTGFSSTGGSSNGGGGGGAMMTRYADGGRATTASIFGEQGAEWAIPEEHSARTADLLDSARRASGFSWPELIARTGGLNANADNKSTTLVYSPTINAGNASGIAEALQADKVRLESWWRQMMAKERMVSYT